jgi:hypothetical protein
MNNSAEVSALDAGTTADIEALSEAVNLAPLGVLSSGTVAQLDDLRTRLMASAASPK